MTGEKSESGFLRKAFVGALKVATIGLLAAVAWQVFLDPIFFPIFHDPTNATAQALVSMIHTNFSWIPEMLGLTGGGGLLNTEFAQAALGPYYAPSPEAVAMAMGGGAGAAEIVTGAANFSLDDL